MFCILASVLKSLFTIGLQLNRKVQDNQLLFLSFVCFFMFLFKVRATESDGKWTSPVHC